jgi:hypothetical protein
MTKFSERFGFSPVRTILQVSDVDEGLRGRLWNLISNQFFGSVPQLENISTNYLPNVERAYATFKNLFHNYFKKPTDEINYSYIKSHRQLKSYVMGTEWFRVYDLLEFLVNKEISDSYRQSFINSINEILKEEMSGYRFVSGRLVQITNEEEIAAIEKAQALSDSLKPVRDHLNQALAHLSSRTSPDYRNSIKESISAVEAISKIISGLPKTTLGPALNAVDKKAQLHASLKEGFQKLYGYTSDAQGIRHALMDESHLDLEDARFMLVSCSAFVNYMIVKAHKAGIKI